MKKEIRMAKALSPALEAKTFELQGISYDLLENGKQEQAVDKIFEAWNLLPEPRFNTSCSHSILCQLVQTLTQTKKHHQVRIILDQWIQDVEESGYSIIEFEPFIYSGENFLFTGQPEKAKEQFYRAVDLGARKRDFIHYPPLYLDIAIKKITDTPAIMEVFNNEISNTLHPESLRHTPLEDTVIDAIEDLSELGNIQFEAENFTMAIQIWQKALDLIPEPRQLYPESQWLEVSIGDAYFLLEKHHIALEYFQKAKNNIEENAYENPFIMLRLEQTLLENNQKDHAKQYLMRAYLFEGKEIFENDNAKYFEFLTLHVDLDR